MTVIMGHKTANKMYLGADNRVCTTEDKFIRDDDNKIVVVNKNVAVAFAGNAGMQLLFEKIIKNQKDDIVVEDVLKHLETVYAISNILYFVKKYRSALNCASRFIVAGKNRNGDYCMYTMSIVNRKLEKPRLVEGVIFPPSDANAKECFEIYDNHIKASDPNFIQNTIKDISKISKVISSSGDIWIYDMVAKDSSLEHFE